MFSFVFASSDLFAWKFFIEKMNIEVNEWIFISIINFKIQLLFHFIENLVKFCSIFEIEQQTSSQVRNAFDKRILKMIFTPTPFSSIFSVDYGNSNFVWGRKKLKEMQIFPISSYSGGMRAVLARNLLPREIKSTLRNDFV